MIFQALFEMINIGKSNCQFPTWVRAATSRPHHTTDAMPMTMYFTARRVFAVLALTLILATLSTGQQSRRNIGAFFEKLRAGKPVTIAYLGGSLTAGAGSSDAAKTSYRSLVTQWVRSRAPQSKITEINAAVEGTGSTYGAIRVRRDVIAHKPDLVFIEFAGHDACDSEEVVKKAVEGVIRQLLSVPQPPEIVLLYPTDAARDRCVAGHEAVAEYYQTPAIYLQASVKIVSETGESAKSAVWKEGVYPNDQGHKICAEQIISFLSRQERLKASAIIKQLPPLFFSDELTFGELKPFLEINHDSAWSDEPISDRALPAKLLASNKAGAQIEAIFDGTVVGLVLRMGPDGGMIECLIDGKPAPTPLTRIDCYSSAPRLKTQIFAGGLPPGEHKLTIRVLGEKNPKSSGHHVRLGYLLVGGQRIERL